MNEYTNLFEFDAPQINLDAEDSGYPVLPPDLDQSAVWTARLQPSVYLMEGDTAAQLQLDVDPAPLAGAESLGQHSQVGTTRACAVCHAPYQTDSALHQHAIEAQHQAYKCHCGTGFNKSSALKRHIDTQHSSTTFACVLCRDEFIRKDKLKDHWRNYHKISEEGVKFLSQSQELQPRVGAPSRRRRGGPVRKPTASSGPPAPGLSPARALATSGGSIWSFASSAGQQYASLPTGPFVPAGPPVTSSPFVPVNSSVSTGLFVPSADPFSTSPALNEDFSSTLTDIFGDEASATGFDDFIF